MKNGDYLLVKAPSNYTGKLYRTKYCYEHHLVYWKNTGIVLRDDEVIHHVDGDKHNNNFNNLELLKRSEHTKNHTLSRGKTFVLLKCPCCEIIFEREKRQSHLSKGTKYTSCSKECSGKISNNIGTLYSLDDNILDEYKKYN